MAGIFDSIPAIAVTLFAVGLVGIMVYERSRARAAQQEEGPAAAEADDAGAAPGSAGREADQEAGRGGRDGGPGGKGSGRRGRKRARA